MQSWEPLCSTASTLNATGAPMPVLHAAKSIGPQLVVASPEDRRRALEMFEMNCRFAQAIGAGLVVLHLWGLPDSDTRIDRQLEVLPRLADAADDHGLRLSIETLLCQQRTPVDVPAGEDPRPTLHHLVQRWIEAAMSVIVGRVAGCSDPPISVR